MRTLLAAVFLAGSLFPAAAATVYKTYSYFGIGGKTLQEIETELGKRGPQVKSTGRRHPGATRMAFNTRLGFVENDGFCRIARASVRVQAKVILPWWRKRKGSDLDVRLFWDTLSSDIKRHEESHLVIAKNFARDLEQAYLAIGKQDTCAAVKDKAQVQNEKIMARHERAQQEFDRVEEINFESRILRLMIYRLERIADGRLKG